MEIHLCPSCGTIIRNRSKFCASCNAPISIHSLTTVQVAAQSTPPLAVPRLENKLILERTINYLNHRTNHHQSSYLETTTADESNAGGRQADPTMANEASAKAPPVEGLSPASLNDSPYGGSYADNTHSLSSTATEQPLSSNESHITQDDAGQFKGMPASLTSNAPAAYEEEVRLKSTQANGQPSTMPWSSAVHAPETKDSLVPVPPPTIADESTPEDSRQVEPAPAMAPQPAATETSGKPLITELQDKPAEAISPAASENSSLAKETGPAPWLVAASTGGQADRETGNFSTPASGSFFFDQNTNTTAAPPAFNTESPATANMVFPDNAQESAAPRMVSPETAGNGDARLPVTAAQEYALPNVPPGTADFFAGKPQAAPAAQSPVADQAVEVAKDPQLLSPVPEENDKQETGSGVFYTGDSFFDSAAAAPILPTNSSAKSSSLPEADFVPNPDHGSGQPSIIANAIQAALNAKKAMGEDSGAFEHSRSNPDNGTEQKSEDSRNSPKPRKSAELKPLQGSSKPSPKSKSTAKKKAAQASVAEIDDDSDVTDTLDNEEDPAGKINEKNPPAKNKKLSAKSRARTHEPDMFKWLKIGAVLLICVGLPVMVLISQVSGLVQSFGSLPITVPGKTKQISQPVSQPSNTLTNGPFGAFGGLRSAQLPPDNLSGLWQIMFEIPNGNPTTGVMQLAQNGDEIRGSGEDTKHYVIAGMRKGNTVSFRKQYVVQNKKHGPPILYQGQLIQVNQAPPYVVLQGIWKIEKQGHQFNWRQNLHQQSYSWQARLNTKFTPEQIAEIFGKTPAMVEPSHAAGAAPTAFNIHQFVPLILIGLVAVGAGMWLFMTKIFGPSGIVNILAKKEYIPSQFKAEHYKMVNQLGKPAGPGSLPLGSRVDWSIFRFFQARTLNLPLQIREQNPHMLVLGAGAKGKSRLLASMIAADIASEDRAVVVIDSDGALVDLLVDWMAAHPKGSEWAERVVIIDPTHPNGTVSYNPLEFPSDGDLQNAASSIVFGFKAIYTEPPGSQSQWNQQTANILRNAAMLLMANDKTLTDLPILLADNDFRDVLLEKIERMKTERAEFTTLAEAWTNYKRLARTDQWINWIEPILNRVQPMLSDARIRRILTNPQSDIDLKEIILNKNILLVKIPQGQLDQNGNLLGSLMVTGIKQAALSLSVRRSDKRRPCALYLDELDSFIEKETFDAISSETKKFQIGFIGASKTLQTLPEDYRSQLIINVGTMAIFALAKKDGDILGPQMFRVDGRKMKHQTMQNFFNRVNTSPQFELISDEEKLNIDRIVGQQERTYFCYRVGTVAGVFNLRAPEFSDPPEDKIDEELIEQMYENRSVYEG